LVATGRERMLLIIDTASLRDLFAAARPELSTIIMN
jgi:hypothetical protein